MDTTPVEIHQSYTFASEISTHFTETKQKSEDGLVENEDLLHTIYLVLLFITTIAGNIGKLLLTQLVDYTSVLLVTQNRLVSDFYLNCWH